MQKKLIVLAIAGLAAGSAFADTPNVSVYGSVDYGALNRGNSNGAVVTSGTTPNGGPSQTALNSGIQSGSRLGFKGTRDMGNGNTALFELEYGISIDNNGAKSNSTSTNSSNPFWNRHSYVGLTGGWGTLVGGRLEGARYTFSNKYDPFAGGTVGNFASLIGNQARADNAVAYISPTIAGGFSVLAAYTTNLTGAEAKANYQDARLYAIAPQWNSGPLSVTFDHEDAWLHGYLTGGDVKIDVLGGSFDLTAVKLFGYGEHVKTTGSLSGLDQKAYLIGATAPIGSALKLKVSYGSVKDGIASNNDCKKASVGADYALDKSTGLYADFATISNQSSASCTIATSSANYSGSHASFVGVDSTLAGNTTGYGTRGIDVGVNYKF
jgi:predicted porin